MTYQHIPLPNKSQTRLLLLSPAKDKSEGLSGSLVVCEIHKSPTSEAQSSSQYEALSYVWGAPSPSHKLAIGATCLPITANCDAALRRLRHHRKERVLWIDAICIDQTAAGTQDRNSQVAMMGDIYSAASDVLIWLGEGDDKTQALLMHLKRLYLIRDDFWDDARVAICNMFMNKCDTKWKTSEIPAGQEIIEDLFGRPWFERMWTLQELLLAKHATVICGDQSMEWESLCHALELIQASFPLSSKGTRNFVNCFYACSDFKELLDGQTSESKGALSKMVHCSRIRHATNPKDKIFALYGLSLSLGKAMPPPDYTQSIPEVYAKATIAIMEHDASLWPLDNVWSDNRRHDIPSWVPDWNGDYRWSDSILSELGHTPLEPADRDIPSHWDGPMDLEAPLYKASSDFKELKLRACILGAVDRVFNSEERAQAQADVLASPQSSIQYELARRRHGAETVKLFRRVFFEVINGEERKPQLVRLLLTLSPTQPEESFVQGARHLRHILCTELSSSDVQYIYARAKESLMAIKDNIRQNSSILSFVESDLDAALDVILSEHGSECETWREDICDIALHRSLGVAPSLFRLVRGLWINRSVFMTDTGLMGYAYGQLSAKDVIVKFMGAAGPSVLRPSKGGFQVIAPAVVKFAGDVKAVFRDLATKELVLV
ncbi:Fc.00g108160.m01.CDS01 [Cosmosporella sp. VM-42]